MNNIDILSMPVQTVNSGAGYVPIVVDGTNKRILASLLSPGPNASAQDANTVYSGPATGSATAPTFRALVNADIAPAGTALTKTDDTNVTLTLGGSPTTALVNAASLTLGWTGTLAVARGGSGLASGTSGGILGFTGSTTLASSVALTANALVLGGGAGATPTPMGSLGTTTTVLHGNAAGAPTFGAVSLTADISGVLPVANGGTNISSYAVGDILYASGATALSKLADVATGSVLVSGGVTTAPAWSASPTLTTSLTVPTVNGGSSASSVLTLQSTSGTGTTDTVDIRTGSQALAMRVDTSGRVMIGTTSLTESRKFFSTIVDTSTDAAAGHSAIESRMNYQPAGDSSANPDGVYGTLWYNSPHTFTGAGAAVRGNAYTIVQTANAAVNVSTLIGTYGRARHEAAGTVTDAISLYADGVQNAGTGTVTNSYLLYGFVPTAATNNYGVWFSGTPNAGSIAAAAGQNLTYKVTGAGTHVLSTAGGSLTLSAAGVVSGSIPFSTLTGSISTTQMGSTSYTVGLIGFRLSAVDLNAGNTDYPVTISLPTGFTRYIINSIRVSHASVSLTTATAGVFTSTGGGGTTIVTNVALSTITSTAESTNPNALNFTVINAATISYNLATLYFRVGTAQGAPATGDVTFTIIPVS